MAEVEAQPVGRVQLPRCATWSPSARRSASCSRCVAEWLARIARGGVVDLQLRGLALQDRAFGHLGHMWMKTPGGLLRVGHTSASAGIGADQVPCIAHLAADSA
jgi:hypothetical protein